MPPIIEVLFNMKCTGCGHEFPGKSARCPRCQRSTSRRGRASTDSRLLEFPRRARVAPSVESSSPPLPAWRVELNEKVRAIRAKRTSELEAEQLAMATEAELISSAASDQPQPGSRLPSEYADDLPSQERPATPARRSSSNIVEAALIRVKRASENASRAALPKIEPARPLALS